MGVGLLLLFEHMLVNKMPPAAHSERGVHIGNRGGRQLDASKCVHQRGSPNGMVEEQDA